MLRIVLLPIIKISIKLCFIFQNRVMHLILREFKRFCGKGQAKVPQKSQDNTDPLEPVI